MENLFEVENLLKILDELFIEYAVSHVYFHNFLNNLKEKGEFTPDWLDRVKNRIMITMIDN